jgi:hypothetical protein
LIPGKRTLKPGLSQTDIVTGGLVFALHDS